MTLVLIQNTAFLLSLLLFCLLFLLCGLGMIWRPERLFALHQAWQKFFGSADPEGWPNQLRFVGAVFILAVLALLWVEGNSILSGLIHPSQIRLQPEPKRGQIEWLALGLGVFVFVSGAILLVRARYVVRSQMERAPALLLVGEGTMRYWTLLYRLAGILSLVGSLVLLCQWARSLP